jgi:hypothetical protein
MTEPSHAELARVVRDHAGRLAASRALSWPRYVSTAAETGG